MNNQKVRGAPAKGNRDDVLDQTIPLRVSRNQKTLLMEAAGRVPFARWAREHLLEIAAREIAEAKR